MHTKEMDKGSEGNNSIHELMCMRELQALRKVKTKELKHCLADCVTVSSW